jgi:NAD(P)-dependent dehydrogenase (short-subunit alcohol dehydrogenase family)
VERLCREHPGATAHRLDLRDLAAIDATVDAVVAAHGRLDALVHCAGIGPAPGDAPRDRYPRLQEIDAATWDEVLAVNLRSAFFACRAAARHLADGNVVLVGSLDGERPMPTPAHYAASKGALSALARALAKELGERAVRVNVVAPGALAGGVSLTLPPDLEAQYLKHCNLKRRGRLDEVAQVVAFLALHNTYVNGETLILDGGL